jgi:hypothetical protein
VRLVSLILGGTIQRADGPPGTLKEILCEFTVIRNGEIRCGEIMEGWSVRNVAATLALKRAFEQRASGDVFALLIIISSVGGALIRLYLPGEDERDAFRTIFRAIGGGIVCYLAIRGENLPFGEPNMTTFTNPFGGSSMTALTNPATASLLGLLAGMFSTKVFKLLSDVIDSWFDKLTPSEDGSAAANEEAIKQTGRTSADKRPNNGAKEGDQERSAPRERSER